MPRSRKDLAIYSDRLGIDGPGLAGGLESNLSGHCPWGALAATTWHSVGYVEAQSIGTRPSAYREHGERNSVDTRCLGSNLNGSPNAAAPLGTLGGHGGWGNRSSVIPDGRSTIPTRMAYDAAYRAFRTGRWPNIGDDYCYFGPRAHFGRRLLAEAFAITRLRTDGLDYASRQLATSDGTRTGQPATGSIKELAAVLGTAGWK